jgi:hypothetical protein
MDFAQEPEEIRNLGGSVTPCVALARGRILGGGMKLANERG